MDAPERLWDGALTLGFNTGLNAREAVSCWYKDAIDSL